MNYSQDPVSRQQKVAALARALRSRRDDATRFPTPIDTRADRGNTTHHTSSDAIAGPSAAFREWILKARGHLRLVFVRDGAPALLLG